MKSPKVLIILDASAGWSRGILRGFAGVAHERGWTLLHYHPTANLEWLLREWKPDVSVLPPGYYQQLSSQMRKHSLVAVNSDRTAEGIASVCVDEQKIASVAATHLVSKGLKWLTTFRFSDNPFAIEREQQFQVTALELGAKIVQGWWLDNADPPREREDAAELTKWIKNLQNPAESSPVVIAGRVSLHAIVVWQRFEFPMK